MSLLIIFYHFFIQISTIYSLFNFCEFFSNNFKFPLEMSFNFQFQPVPEEVVKNQQEIVQKMSEIRVDSKSYCDIPKYSDIYRIEDELEDLYNKIIIKDVLPSELGGKNNEKAVFLNHFDENVCEEEEQIRKPSVISSDEESDNEINNKEEPVF